MQGYPLSKRIGLVLGLGLFGLMLFSAPPEGLTREAWLVAAAAVLMAVWWITEAAPLPATALLPIALFPLLGVMDAKVVATAYGDRNIWLFAGGFFIAMAMQKWNLHSRIALNITAAVGLAPNRLVLGFMVATAVLSMWISNTATTLMVLPIGLAVIDQVEKMHGEETTARFSAALMLGIAYAASIGGVGTLIGTPPNIVLAAQLKELYPDAPELGFARWAAVGIPFVFAFLPVAYIVLTRVLFRTRIDANANVGAVIAERRAALGSMSRGEWIVLVVASLTALAWIFRRDIALPGVTIPGWSNLFPNPALIHDSTVAIFAACLLFVIPVDRKKGEFALDWAWAQRIPWGILILFGGGLALAKGCKETGLIEWTAQQLSVLEGAPPLAVVGLVAGLMTFLTEMTSNTATTTIFLPILGVTATDVLQVHPLLLMIPATVSASCAFMLPVATPPNAIIFGSGRVRIHDMVKAGLVLNLIGLLAVTAIVYFVAIPVFGIEASSVPIWAHTP
jgi:sodium-dependent dicarboxylate transporter 2/3/5